MTTTTKANEAVDLWDFSKIVSHGIWQPVPHINLIIELLHYGLNGQFENLAIALSPRLGKSMQISEIFPAYYLGYRPYGKIIHVSYSDSLARSFGSKAKANLEEFGHLFPEKPVLSQDTKAKNWFKIEGNTGEYFCTGSSGSVLGRGAQLIIVDDPTKNIEEARSPRHQEKLIDLFDTTISTRKEKDPFTGHNALTLIIHQRLDTHDLIGIITEQREWITAEEALPRLRRGERLGHVWIILRLPELAEDHDILGREIGEPLWPQKRTKKELAQIKKDIGSYKFQAIHQQDPQNREGGIFQPEWFLDPQGEIHKQILINQEDVEEEWNTTRYWDFAASGREGDATAGLKTSYHNNTLTLIDLKYGRYTSQQTLKTYEKTTTEDGKRTVSIIEEEPGSGSKLLITRFQQSPLFRGHSIRKDKVRIPKADRAFDLAAICEDQKLKMVKAWWNMKLIKQLISFTGEEGGDDDIVDTATGSARYWKGKRAVLRPRR